MRKSGLHQIPGSIAWTVSDYHLSVRERLDERHESLVMWIFDLWLERSGMYSAITPARPPRRYSRARSLVTRRRRNP